MHRLKGFMAGQKPAPQTLTLATIATILISNNPIKEQ
jgi:hypothetical protein